MFFDPSSDNERKIHGQHTIRVGGLCLFLAASVGLILKSVFTDLAATSIGLKLSVFSTVFFLVGFVEDIASRFSARARLLALAGISIVATLTIDFPIDSVGIYEFFGLIPAYPEITWLFVAFVIVGVTNAYNIVDGANGLCAGLGLAALFPLAWVLFELANYNLWGFGLIYISAIFGFFLINFLSGRIFLGDGGAYLIGFLCVSFSLIATGPKTNNISPWFAILVNAYPITETIFSIIRRCVVRVSPFQPDSYHMHTLCFNLLQRRLSYKAISPSIINSLSAIPILVSSVVVSFLALVYRKDSQYCVALLTLYVFAYLTAYSFLRKMNSKQKHTN